MTKKKLLFIFGTRPEAIKLAPLILAFKAEASLFECEVCSTGQHSTLLQSALQFFQIQPDFNLNVMQPNQSLFKLSAGILEKMERVFQISNPDYIFVQGDTSTAFLGALAAFYSKKAICHIEAGLRTFDKMMPFPEEVNRRMISQLADWHFAPTPGSYENLLNEGIPAQRVVLTGNTGIDALVLGLKYLEKCEQKVLSQFSKVLNINLLKDKRLILVTLHRRESQGEVMLGLMNTLIEISKFDKVQIIFPVHPNPAVMELAQKTLEAVPDIHLLPAQPYQSFIWLMKRSSLILTDSGGIQEEAHYLGKPLVILRENTEREEGLEQGTGILAGTKPSQILGIVKKLLNNQIGEKSNSNLVFGNGQASKSIVEVLKRICSGQPIT